MIVNKNKCLPWGFNQSGEHTGIQMRRLLCVCGGGGSLYFRCLILTSIAPGVGIRKYFLVEGTMGAET